jgi:hypothetical protein
MGLAQVGTQSQALPNDFGILLPHPSAYTRAQRAATQVFADNSNSLLERRVRTPVTYGVPPAAVLVQPPPVDTHRLVPGPTPSG